MVVIEFRSHFSVILGIRFFYFCFFDDKLVWSCVCPRNKLLNMAKKKIEYVYGTVVFSLKATMPNLYWQSVKSLLMIMDVFI